MSLSIAKRAWRLKNREHLNAESKRRRQENPEAYREYCRRWYVANQTSQKARSLSRYKVNASKLAILKNRPCMDCAGWFESCQMQFDHRPGEIKLFGIGNKVSGSLKNLLEEIKKCDLVCANCHALRTYLRSPKNYVNAL